MSERIFHAHWLKSFKHNHKKRIKYKADCNVCNGGCFDRWKKVDQEIEEEDFIRGLKVLTCAICNFAKPISLPLIPDIIFIKDDNFDRMQQHLQSDSIYHKKANFELRSDIHSLCRKCQKDKYSVCRKCVDTHNKQVLTLEREKLNLPKYILSLIHEYLSLVMCPQFYNVHICQRS